MSESWKTKMGELKARLTDTASSEDGNLDVNTFMSRVRETVSTTVSDVDADAVATRLKAALGQADDKIDTSKAREFIAGLDKEKLTELLDEAKTRGEPAARLVAEHGARLAESMPGSVDKLVGSAKEKLGGLAGDEELTHAGELDQLKGHIKEKFAAADAATEATRDET